MIYREIFMDDKIAHLSKTEKLLFIGLLLYANDYGCFKLSYPELKAKIFLFDDNITQSIILDIIEKFTNMNLLKKYNEDHYYFPNWFEYQSIKYLEKPRIEIYEEALKQCPKGAIRYNWRQLKQKNEVIEPKRKKQTEDKSIEFITYWKQIGLKGGLLNEKALDSMIKIDKAGKQTYRVHMNKLLNREPYKSSWKQILYCLSKNKWLRIVTGKQIGRAHV